jgi:hypothetical protein
VLGSQAQPGDTEAGQIGGSQPMVGPTSGGQVQLPFTQMGATAVVAVQLETAQAILPTGPHPPSAPWVPSCCGVHPNEPTAPTITNHKQAFIGLEAYCRQRR